MIVRVLSLVVLLSLFFTQDTYLPTLTAQTTTVTKTVQNPDGTYTIIEYPAKKEVIVNLQPNSLLPEATGRAKILRTDEGTLIDISLAMAGPKTDMLEKKGVKYRGWQISTDEFKTCVDNKVIAIEGGVVRKTNETCKGTIISYADLEELNLYAVDDRGDVTALGSITINNGVGTKTFATPLSRFMLVLSPQEELSSYDPNTRVTFRSTVPEGFAVIPVRSLAGGEKVAATTGPGATAGTSYSVPMLNIPAYKRGDDANIKVDFSGPLTGTRASLFITPRKDGPTEVSVRFHDLKAMPAGKRYILWAVSSDNRFVNLGQILSAERNEAEIRAETTLPDFGLLMTMEDLSVTPPGTPTGPTVATFHIVP